MARKMTKWIDHVLGPGYHRYCPGDAWSPCLNVYEDRQNFHVVVDLAGVRPSEVDLRVDGKTLVLSGSRRMPEVPKSAGEVQLHLMEIDHGGFCRSLELPPGVDAEKIEANYRAGFLWIRLPKLPRPS